MDSATGSAKEEPPFKRHKEGTPDMNFPDQIFSLVVEFIPCYDLGKVALVSKCWKKLSTKSYRTRANKPWVLPNVAENTDETTRQQKIFHATGNMEAGLKLLRDNGNDPTKLTSFLQKLQQVGDQWRFVQAPKHCRLWDDGCFGLIYPNVVPILPLLPLEKDLPSFLQDKNTTLQYCSLVDGKLLLLVSREWSPSYHNALKAEGLEDHYQKHVDRFPQTMENPDDYDPEAFQDVFEEEDMPPPGIDVWGLLYQVATNADSNDKPSTRLVDQQRVTQCDFQFFAKPGFQLDQSKSGNIVCLLTGLCDADSPQCCIPTMITLELSKAEGIRQHTPLSWPNPGGLEDTYNADFSLTPSGDHMLACFGDKGDTDSMLFYKLKRGAAEACLGTWETLWEDPDEDSTFRGFFTVDGDFAVTENRELKLQLPGPLASKTVWALEPSQFWLRDFVS